MQTELQRVLEIQPSWTWQNTAEMRERGELVRNEVTGWLRTNDGALSAAIDTPVLDFLAEGRDGTGRKTRVPWTRFGSSERSPSATDGFYVVYLWAFDGHAVYLSLNQGTTDFENGQFVRKPHNVLESRVSWARDVVADWASSRADLIPLDLRDVGEDSLGHGYELGNIASIRYAVDAIPSHDQLLADAVSFAATLGDLYRAHGKEPLPYEVPELAAIEDAVDEAAGKPQPAKSGGFRLNAQERQLIERHAMDLACTYYEADGWTVERKGAPYDLKLTRGSESSTVEVKGTTSRGEAVPLTYGEVQHHNSAHPNNALVVVREIELDRSTSPPTAKGGVLFERRPWVISGEDLRIVSYRYTVPTALYGPGTGTAAENLL